MKHNSRLIPVALLLLVFSTGCTSMHAASRSDPADIELLNDRFNERPATVRFADGSTATGVIQFVRADSIGWTTGGVYHAESIDEVARLARHRDRKALGSGMLIGAGVGIGLAVLWYAAFRGDGWLRSLTPFMIPTGISYGVIFGESVARRRIYILEP